MTNSLKVELLLIEVERRKIKHATALAEKILERCQSQIIGRRIDGNFVAAHLKGKFEITAAELTYDAEVRVSGRKVLSNGGLGSVSHDLGVVSPKRLGLP